MSVDDYEQAESVGQASENTTKTFTLVSFLITLMLGYGLKFIWNSVNILQFVVFISLWKVNLPLMAQKFISGLKQLALFEFIPYKEIISWLGVGCLQDCHDLPPEE